MTALSTLRAGGKPALAQALAALERDPDSADTLALLDEAFAQPMAQVIGLTGPPGVGKSTLAGALIQLYRGQAKDRRCHRRRSELAAHRRRAAGRPHAHPHRSRRSGRVRALDGGARPAGRPLRSHLWRHGADARALRHRAGGDGRRRPVGDRDRAHRRYRGVLRAARLRRQPAIHEGRHRRDSRHRRRHQVRPRRARDPRQGRRERRALFVRDGNRRLGPADSLAVGPDRRPARSSRPVDLRSLGLAVAGPASGAPPRYAGRSLAGACGQGTLGPGRAAQGPVAALR